MIIHTNLGPNRREIIHFERIFRVLKLIGLSEWLNRLSPKSSACSLHTHAHIHRHRQTDKQIDTHTHTHILKVTKYFVVEFLRRFAF